MGDAEVKVTRKKLADYIQNPENPVGHNSRNLGVVVDSIHKVGAFRSGAASKGKILAGNLTWEAMAEAGIEDVLEITTDGKTWVIVNREDLTPEQEREAAYFDQRGAELATWNPDQLLADLDAGFDFKGLFGDAELAEVLEGLLEDEAAEDVGPMTDRAEELQEKWQVKQDDVWEVAGHLVICGDCREAETWGRLLSAAGVDKANGVFTSPPYAEQRKKQYGGVPVDEYVGWWELVQENVRANLAEDGSFFVNIKPHCEKGERVLYVFDLVLAMKRRWGWRFVDELCWHKSNAYPGDFAPRLRNAWESIYHWALGKCKSCFGNVLQDAQESSIRRHSKLTDLEATGARIHSKSGSGFNIRRKGFQLERGVQPTNVIYCSPEVRGGQTHSGTFPIPLPDFFIRAYSDPGDVWVDPFLGSGTTIVAAHQNERHGLGIELLEKYVSVTLERMAELTGEEPRLLT